MTTADQLGLDPPDPLGPLVPALVPVTQHVPLLDSVRALSAGVIWSLGVVTARKASHSDAFQYLIWRSVAIIVVIEVVARIRRRRPMTPQAFRGGPLMLLTCACLLLASLAYVYAVKNTAPANAAFLASVTPLIAVMLARVVLGERLNAITIGAVVVAFVGLCITLGGDLQAGNMVGNFAAVASSIGFAGYTVCVRRDPHRDWSPVMPGYAVMMIVLCGIVTVGGGRTLVPPPGDIALAALHGGAFIVVGTLLFNQASRRIPAVAMTVFAQTEMLFVAVWAVLLLDDTPTTSTMVGGLVIAAAVMGKALLDSRRRRTPLPTPAPIT